MALDGNGTYFPPAPQFPAIPNTVIYADDFNQIILDIATALSTAIFRDGQAAFTADQSLGGFKITDLANGTLPQDAATVLQVFTDPQFIATTLDGFKVTGSMFQALMTAIRLIASGDLTLSGDNVTLTGTTLLDASASGEVRLPANTTLGTVSPSQLNSLQGVTSNVQGQLDSLDLLKAPLADPVFTGNPRAPTPAFSDNDDTIATTAFTQTIINAAIQPGAGSPMWVSGTDYVWGSIVWSPLDFKSYRDSLGGVSVVDPSLDSARWVAQIAPVPGFVLMSLGVV